MTESTFGLPIYRRPDVNTVNRVLHGAPGALFSLPELHDKIVSTAA